MRKWVFPLTIFSVGGLGVLVLSDHGRKALRWISVQFNIAPQQFMEWNEAAQRELDRVQSALNRMADALDLTQ